LNTIGRNKAEVLCERFKEINCTTEIICFNHYFGLNNDDLDNIKNVDIIFNCADVFVNNAKLRKLYRQLIIDGIPYIDCPAGITGGLVCIETSKSLDHFDY
jgi:tRNA A37 threonylcarbamoyladenosine dehydratase